jgi:hypothetical protein
MSEVLEEVIEEEVVDETGDDIPEDEMAALLEAAYDGPVPWHGVLAPVGKMSGDQRIFDEGVIGFRELPLPFKAMAKDLPGHDESVVVGNIERIWEEGGLILGEGTFASTEEAAYFIQLRAENAMRGVSVDLDMAESVTEDLEGNPIDLYADGPVDVTQMVERVTKGRIASATICAIPAFQEAYFDLGTWEEAFASNAECVDCPPEEMVDPDEEDIIDVDSEPIAAAGGWGAPEMTLAEFAISEAPWDGSAANYTDQQWKFACLVDRGEEFETAKERYALPVKTPEGDLSRAGVHAAAGRVDQVDAPPEAIAKAKAALRSIYAELNEEPPDSITASAVVEEFAPGTKDGPGWLTNPEDTARIRHYWVKGKGAAKIRWGVPGDFNRCRKQLVKYVQNPEWLAGLCSNMHKEALGFWPGGETGGRGVAAEEVAVTASASVEMTPAYTMVDIPDSLVASAAAGPPPMEWFENPNLEQLTPLTITDDGRVFGHAAGWGVCHIGLDRCVMAPKSASQYAYFHTGALQTDKGLISVGQITMGTGHASLDLAARPAVEHYDNTGTVVADIRCGEDKFGIWMAGQLRPDVDELKLRKFRAAGVSGDWREIGGQAEFVAALAVNTQGFPIPRLGLAASGSRMTALVAAAVVIQDEREHDQDDALREFAKVIIAEVHADAERTQKVGEIRAAVDRENGKRREEVLAALGEED